jgi:hypothetical protein
MQRRCSAESPLAPHDGTFPSSLFVSQMPGFDKHIVRVAKAMPAGGVEVSAVRGALRGAVHGRSMPVDAVHSGAGSSGSDLSGLTVLMIAAQRGRADVVKVLLKEFGAGAGAVTDSTSARAALALALTGDHATAASELQAWLGEGFSGNAGEDGEVMDDEEEGELTQGSTTEPAPRIEPASSTKSVFARLKMTAGSGSSSTNTGSTVTSGAGLSAGASSTVVSPKWKKDYSELSFAEKLRMLKSPAASADATVAQAPQDGWIRFGAVHSQWRDHLDIRSDGSFSRGSRDDGGRWREARWEDELVGEFTIHWANWDVSDTLRTTDGGASFHAVGTNQWGDEYQFTLKVTQTSSEDGAGAARSTLSLPAWFNPAAPEVLAASGDFRGKARRRDRPTRGSTHEDTDRGQKRQRQSDSSASMPLPKASRLKMLERGAKFGTLTAEQAAELAKLQSSNAGNGGSNDEGDGDAGSRKKKRPTAAASLDDDMDDYFKK